MKFYQRLEWQLAIVIVILVGITITYTGLLQQTTVGIFLSTAPKENSVSGQFYQPFLASASEHLITKQNIQQQAHTLTKHFANEFRHSEDILLVTDPLLNIIAAHHPDYVIIELVRSEPDNSGYSIVLSSVYNKRELFQIYQSVPPFPLGDKGLAFIVPDPTITSSPKGLTLLRQNLEKHFQGLGLYYLAIAIFIVIFVRMRLSPLRRLEQFSRQLSSERLPAPMSPSPIRDELSQLITAFNEALNRLSHEKQQRTSLLADMAHELRTPLHNLKGRLELEAEGITPASETSTHYTLKQIDQLVQLVNDIDLMNSMDERELSLQKTNVNLNHFICETLDVISHPNKFLWQITGTKPPVNIDCVRMVQVFENLLHNAMRAKPENLCIRVDIQNNSLGVIINIWDNGPGVPKEALKQLFQRLYRVDKSRHQNTGGSGLGLSIVKKIIKLHHGTIESYQPKEGGLGFIIHLPHQV